MLQVPTYKLGEKEEEMMEPKHVEIKDPSKYNFDFEAFDEKLEQVVDILYPEDCGDVYTMLGAYKNKTIPLGVLIIKKPESDTEKQALKAHLQNYIKKLDLDE